MTNFPPPPPPPPPPPRQFSPAPPCSFLSLRFTPLYPNVLSSTYSLCPFSPLILSPSLPFLSSSPSYFHLSLLKCFASILPSCLFLSICFNWPNSDRSFFSALTFLPHHLTSLVTTPFFLFFLRVILLISLNKREKQVRVKIKSLLAGIKARPYWLRNDQGSHSTKIFKGDRQLFFHEFFSRNAPFGLYRPRDLVFWAPDPGGGCT